MLTKFESKSNRVKGLSFHKSRPWILTSLHNGVIQLWDYRMGTLLDRFDEHDGPVRGIDFHESQPLFVSGGDDYKIKVWDYKLRRCLYTLLGHLDYIRTVQFHPEYPWIVSCSDDQTIRIWNWQSRSCISVLTGHNHYVMSVQFHPKDDLIVSASLDQTVRVWDTTGLRKKTVRGVGGADTDPMMMMSGSGGSSSMPGSSSNSGGDIFGGTDAIVKYVLEGHDRGVNWASFHPSLPLIVSGADDRQIKLWRMNETKAWEVDTMRGHTNNVSCVIFHPRHELILSNSEDRSIRVWDISKRLGVQTFRRESDRFWIMQAHPTQNLLAAGHDSGMIVFKLERERPALDVSNDRVFYVKERYIRLYEISTGRDLPVVSLRRTGTLGTGLGNLPRLLQYNAFNQSEENILIWTQADGGAYELVTFKKDASGQYSDSADSRRGSGLGCCFVARNRFAVLDKSSKELIIKNLDNEITKKITLPSSAHHTSGGSSSNNSSAAGGGADGLFFGGLVGRVLLRHGSEDRVCLFETQSRRVLADLYAPRVKYVIWNSNHTHVALLSKHSIVIADRNLKHLSTIKESVRIKSGVWSNDLAEEEESEVFVYTTLNHIKYTLANGDNGLIRSLDVPLYLTHFYPNHGGQLHALDRQGGIRTLCLELSEVLLKQALVQKNYPVVLTQLKESRLEGQAIVHYLNSKGYPELALQLVKEDKTRFNLAVSCGNLEVAVDAAMEVDELDCWHQLGLEALRQGNLQLVEMALQRTKNFEKLSFLYLLSGNRQKLKKMLTIASKRQDVMGFFHNALYLGDLGAQSQLLQQVNQLPLALTLAQTHQQQDVIDSIQSAIDEQEEKQGEQEGEKIDHVAQLLCEMEAHYPVANRSCLLPPAPICVNQCEDNWPLKEVTPTDSATMLSSSGNQQARSRDGFDLDPQDNNTISGRKSSVGSAGAAAAGDWNMGEDDLDFDDDTFDDLDDDIANGIGGGGAGAGDSVDNIISAPVVGASPPSQWVSNSNIAGDHVAAGSFKTGCELLNRQIGVINFEPLKSLFLQIRSTSCCYLPTASQQTLVHHLTRESKVNLPMSTLSLTALAEQLKWAYRAFTQAKFADVVSNLHDIIYAIPLLVVDSQEEANRVKELLAICREYLLACRIKEALNETPLDTSPARNVELSAYFTHCVLQPSHLLLTLRIAMTNSYKTNNFISAASFCRRLLELPEMSSERQAKLRMTARKVLQKAEKEARNEQQLNYQETKKFDLCGRSLTPIYAGEPNVKCPYCLTCFKPQYKGGLCDVCNLSKIGEETLGLVVSSSSSR